jgi:hypothetical protein
MHDVYQVVGHARTGSTVLNHFAVEHNDGIGFNEYFNDGQTDKRTRGIFDNEVSLYEKFKYLEYQMELGIHFSLKVFPVLVIKQGYENSLYEYLSNYKILTIKRNPFDSFLSLKFQDSTKWKFPHRLKFKNYQFCEPEPFSINRYEINGFIHSWKKNQDFIDKLNIYHTFDYDEITADNLYNFFGLSEYTWNGKKSNINYEEIVENIDEVKEIFYNEMYGT